MSSMHIDLVIILFSVNVVLICLIAYIVRQTLQIKKYYLKKLEEKNRNNVLWIENDDSGSLSLTLTKMTSDKLLKSEKNNKKPLITFVPCTPAPTLTKNVQEVEEEEDEEEEEEEGERGEGGGEDKGEFYCEMPIHSEIYDTPSSINIEHEYSVPPEIDNLPLPRELKKKRDN